MSSSRYSTAYDDLWDNAGLDTYDILDDLSENEPTDLPTEEDQETE